MSIHNALAGVAVSNLQVSILWYEKLLGRPADSRPMPEVAEWHFARGGWLQVFHDAGRAGSSTVTLAVSDIRGELEQMGQEGITAGRKTTSGKVNTATIEDPDGNQIVIAEATVADMIR
jgi:predicted enzyme related to lactoylglutathione lyase